MEYTLRINEFIKNIVVQLDKKDVTTFKSSIAYVALFIIMYHVSSKLQGPSFSKKLLFNNSAGFIFILQVPINFFKSVKISIYSVLEFYIF
jgi:hypothetical protein